MSKIFQNNPKQFQQSTALLAVANALDPTRPKIWAKLALSCIKSDRWIAAAQAVNFSGEEDRLSGEMLDVETGGSL